MSEPFIETSENMQTAVSLDSEQSFRSDFELKHALPGPLAFLETLSGNFYWSWNEKCVGLFRDIDATVWDLCEQNPRRFLNEVKSVRLWQKASDESYLKRLREAEKEFLAYLEEPVLNVEGIDESSPVAYFCAEYGVHNSLPIYSGGLGILAGDHLKSASDLKLPLVAVGLLYRYGYFRQRIEHDGWQKEGYTDSFENELALEPVLDEEGNSIRIMIHMRGREVFARAWLARIGRIALYLLDTNVKENQPVDRFVTGHLYGGDAETRIVQEKILGIGGVRLLRKLGIDPSVYHLNEGHSAFLTLELAREFLESYPTLTFVDAISHVRKKCVFTTHTPVDAGNDTFDPEIIKDCFDGKFIESLGISFEELFELGKSDADDPEEWFGMTPLAIRLSRMANGVSKKHGEVSRELWKRMFPAEIPVSRVPIGSVTNGVHPPTWIGPSFKELYERKLGPGWQEKTADSDGWRQAVSSIPDTELWEAHLNAKHLLISFIRERTRRRFTGEDDTINEHRNTEDLLDPAVLTIGFARRIAGYKRWNLLMTDLDRLLRMVDDPERPVQFVFAGKAHPQDKKAKTILQELLTINHDSNWQNRAVFIEDYDQEVARYLVRGVDVWMNVPRRPLEASGTSGQKVAMNGGLNFSVLDGWWLEGFNGNNGFAVGPPEDPEGKSQEEIDKLDAQSLYETLENEIIPAYYEIAESGLPEKWISIMKESIATLTHEFSSDRMVMDYLSLIYQK